MLHNSKDGLDSSNMVIAMIPMNSPTLQVPS